jgi:hypothetical protein
MVRGPKSGNGMRSSVYSLAAPDLGSLDLGSPDRGWACPRARSLDEAGELDAGYPSPGSGSTWNGAGGRWLLWPFRAVLLALVNGQLPGLDVPVAAPGAAVAVSGEPALLPVPEPISLPAAAARGSDPVVQSQLNNELPAFFQACANSDSAALNRFLAPGVPPAGLGGTVSFGSIAALHVPPGDVSRQITVSVLWELQSQGCCYRRKTPGNIPPVGRSTKRPEMVCKRNRCVDRGGGSPMTRTRTADAVVSACARTVSGRPSTAAGRLVSGTVACIGWASRQSAVSSCQPVLAHRPLPRQRAAVPCRRVRLGSWPYVRFTSTRFGGLSRLAQDGHLIPEGTFYVY